MRKFYSGLLLFTVALLFAGSISAQTISYTAVVSSCGNGSITLSSVHITDGTGIVIAGANMPRIYYRKNSGAWVSSAGSMTSGSATDGFWSFVMSESAMGGLTAGNTVQYYVIAQNATTVASEPAGVVATDVNTIITPPVSPESLTVNAFPTDIGGVPFACEGTTTTLSSFPAGGNWTSSTPATGTVSSSGVVGGIAVGTTEITYTIPSTGCFRTRVVTVNQTPTVTTVPDPAVLCRGSSYTFSGVPAGGTWSTTGYTVANVNVSTGAVTTVGGTTTASSTITYTLGTGCRAVTPITVNGTPVITVSTPPMCEGTTRSLGANMTGGTWSSADNAIASITSSTGFLSAVAAGITDISYVMPLTGCFTTKEVTVNALPSVITGGPEVCSGSTIAMSSTPAGGTWTSSTSGVAFVNSSTGVVTGNTSGTARITYSFTYAPSAVCVRTTVVTVNPLPAIISGTSSVCVGNTTSLSSATAGGTWSSSDAGVANITDPTMGVITGVSAGTATITYMVSPSGCFRTMVVTVNPLPATIGGTLAICEGLTTTLTNSTGGGTWSSSTTAVATINASTGLVNAMTGGTSTITYRRTSTGCIATSVLTVNSTPAVLSGATNLCVAGTTTLTCTDGGGTWVSSNTSVATIAGTGVVTGVGAGTSVITYTLPTGCIRTTTVTVNVVPSAVSGVMVVCEGSSTNLTSTPGGGTWSSSDAMIASVNSSTGVVTGMSDGTADITYNVGGGVNGCLAIAQVTVNPRPAVLTGFPSVCIGSVTTLFSLTGGGVWTTGHPAIASVDATGNVTGLTTGTASISYTLSTGCARVQAVTVSNIPAPISGLDAVCVGSNISLTSGPGGGTWSSTDVTVATITTTGVLTGVSNGVVTVSYILPTGCFRTKVVTVNPLPTAITGPGTVCVGSAISLSSTPAGGTWTSSLPAAASVDAISGNVTGLTSGQPNITYTNPEGCRVSRTITVQALPNPISGVGILCQNSSIVLGNSSFGGTWTSGNPAVASVLSGTGYVTGNLPGTADITYTLSSGCFRTKTLTVNQIPDVIGSLTNEVCVGSSISLTNTIGGGTWSSSATAIANVNVTSGLVTGVSAGTATITYKLSTGCYVTDIVTVNSLPTAITGTASFCLGTTTVLSSLTPAGVWASGNAAVATVDAFGVVSSVSAGTATISYTSPSMCTALKTVTVNALPDAISGTLSLCTGSTTSLSNTAGYGTWVSNNTAVATVNSAGVVTGQSAGTAVITFTMNTGCFATAEVTVNTIPATITGVAVVCAGGSTTTLSSSSIPGTWSSSNTSIASIDITTGVVVSGSVGNATITYTANNGCKTTRNVSVVPTPTVPSGLSSVCQGSTISLASAPGGGTWASSNTAVGTVSTTGLVGGIAPGVTIISYTLSNGCAAGKAVTVDAVASLTSIASVCVGSTTTLTYDITGGSWLSGNPAVATVGLTTGDVTGMVAGTSRITYALPSGCRTFSIVTVNALPGTNTGVASVCLGLSTTLSNTTPGATWSSSNTGIATVGSATGIVVGTGVGTADISAINPATGCARVTTVTVNSLPAAITGTTSMCISNTTTLNTTPAGGTWTSSTASVATVGSVTGVVYGASAGTSTITYRLSTGCLATRVVTVLPAPTPITGSGNVCVDGQTGFYTPTTGGIWSSSNNAIAQVGTDGVVTGFSTGVANISYVLGTTCYATKAVTVLPVVAQITGVMAVCEGSNTSLSCLTPGGTWSSSNTFAASVNLSTGIVTGHAAGTTFITYTAPSGCTDTTIVTVNPVPTSISGNLNVCLGSTTTLTNLTGTGTWSTGNPIVATIDPTTGVATGVGLGTARITYTIGTGCRTVSIITVSALPASITGFTQVCEGFTATLGNVTPGGNWSSSDETIALISSTGIVTGVAPGTTTISYTMPVGCARSVEVTVNAAPGAIGGISDVCLGTTTTLTAAPAGGAFTSSDITKASVGVTSGVMTGVGVGTAVISYTLPTGCRSFTIATVHALPGSITGVTNICEGGSTTLHNPVPGGVWSSDFISVAYIDPSTGEVTGNGVGVDTIRYTLTGGCSTKITITVNSAPSAIAGDVDICSGETTTLTNSQVGGTWSSSNTSVATVGLSSGIVTGYTAGTTNITYTVGAGCWSYVTLVVNQSPSNITGPHEVCSGSSIGLFNTVPGGTWTSNDVSVAPVDAVTGIVTGGITGTATINYMLTGGCVTDFIVTVNPLPAPITGIDSFCQGETSTYTSLPTGGIWTSSDASVAPINLVTGDATGVSTGTSTISYTLLGTGCYRTIEVTVNAVPDPITGTPYVCVGSTTLLSTLSVGGNWSSINTSVALVGSATGLVQGLSADTTSIIYTLPTGCKASAVIAVNPLPDNIVGADEICVGSSTTFTDVTPFGSWSSSHPGRASIDAATGVITGVSNGTATITYTLFSTGCYVIKQITVNPLPPAILGAEYMCLGTVSFVSNPIPGGLWSSSDPGVVAIDGFGNVSASGVGTSTITYALGSACYITRMLTVEPTLNPITGPSSVCEMADITLANDFVGGVWTSSDVAVATVGTSGIVTGVVAGVADITYATPLANCYVTTSVTVDPVPVAITGTDSVCVNATTTLDNLTPGGTWSSSDVAIVTIDAAGDATGVAAGSALISYTVGSGCTAVLPVRVKPLAEAGTISGAAEVCVTATTPLLSDGDAGGTWSSANSTIASIGTDGTVTGVAIGTTVISYLVENFCSIDTATFNILVKPAPDAGTLSAVSAGLCIGYTTTVNSTVPGGVWSSSNTDFATIDAAGVVSAISAGTVTISYTMTNECGVDVSTINVTVYSLAPLSEIVVHPDSVVCANSQYLNFGAETVPGTGVTYTWTVVNAELFAQSAPDRQNALVNFPYAGTAIVRLTTEVTSTGCIAVDSFVVEVSVDSAITPEVKYYANELICTDNTASSYQWGYDDAATLDSTMIFGAFQQSYYLPNPDFTNRRYWVLVKHNGCYQKVYYNAPSGVTTVAEGTMDVRLFPNPADSKVNIEVKGISMNDKITIRLFDMLGKEIETSALVNGKGSIDVARLASGVYSVVFINNGNKVAARTFVKN